MSESTIRPVVLLGAPRSGTTWLQQVLACHDEIASPQETKLVHEYIAPAMRAWQRQPLDDPAVWRLTRFSGLAAALTEDAFIEWLRRLVREVSEQVRTRKPTARYLLIKDPPDCRHVPVLDRVLEPVAYIHLIRDGRDVAASLMRAGRTWGAGWAPRNLLLASRIWRTHVADARAAAQLGAYLEVRYEDLRAEPEKTVTKILELIGLTADHETVSVMLKRADTRQYGESASAALKECLTWAGEVERRGIEVHEPDGFVGDGGGGWQRWNWWRQWLFDWDAGELLAELGYVDRRPLVHGIGHGMYDRLVESGIERVRQISARLGAT